MKKIVCIFLIIAACIGLCGCSNKAAKTVDVRDYFFNLNRSDVNLKFKILECEYATEGYTDNISLLSAVAKGTEEEVSAFVKKLKDAGYEFGDATVFDMEDATEVYMGGFAEEYDPQYDAHYDPALDADKQKTKGVGLMTIIVGKDFVEMEFESKLGTTPYWFVNPANVIIKNTDLGYSDSEDVVYYFPSKEQEGAFDINVLFLDSKDKSSRKILKLDTIKCSKEEITELIEVTKQDDGTLLYHQKAGTTVAEKTLTVRLEDK